MGDSLQPSEKAILLEQYHQRRGEHVNHISPKDEFEAAFRVADAQCREAAQAYIRAGSVVMGSGGDVSSNSCFKDHALAIKRMEELESTRVTVGHNESEYQQRLEQEQANGLLEYLKILGTDVCIRIIAPWLAAQQPPPTPATDQVGNEDHSTSMDLELTPIAADAQQPPAAALPIMDSLPVTDQGHHPDISTNDPQRPTETATMLQDKAQENRPKPEQARITRMADGCITKLTKRAVEFDQVFQDGNPSRPYVIGEHRGRKYILECKKHRKQFRTANPIQGAWKHLRSRKHYSDSYGVTYDMAVAELGTEVLNCDNDDLVEFNNKRAIIYKAKKTDNSQNMDGILPARASQSSSTMDTHRSHFSDIWPQLGEVYKTFWKSERKFYAVLILPLDMNLNFSHLISDWDTTLKHTPLRPRLPSCYVQLEDGRLEFTEDHKPGGSKEAKRKYPVVYFHKARFPSECDLDWIYVSNLEPYDPSDENIEHRHRQQVNEFLSNYSNAENTRIEGANGDDFAEPTAGSLGPETFHDRPQTSRHFSPPAEQSDFSRDNTPLLYDDDTEFERRLTARTRENSSRVKEEVVHPSPMDASGEVQASEQPAIPSQEEQDSQASDHGPVHERDEYHMDVNSYGDTMTTPEEQFTQEEYRAILNDMSLQPGAASLRDPMRPQAEVTNTSVDTLDGLSSTEVPISYDVVANPVLQHTETGLYDVPQSPNDSQRTLHDLYRQTNRLSTVEGHGKLQYTVRSDGGGMWTLTETPNGTSSRTSQSSHPRQRKRERRQPSLFIPRKR